MQKEGGAVDQSLPLAGIYAFRGAAPGGVPAGAYLDEYYCIAVEHDQIELATLPAPVALQQAQAARLQELQRAILGLPASLEVRRLLHGVLSEAGTLVVFLSADVPHEVLPATRDRLSLTGWFRRRGDGVF